MKKRMSLILCLALVVALIPAFFVQANAAEVYFTYTLSEDGQYYIITKIKPDDDYGNIELNLPSFYNGLPVRMVAANAIEARDFEFKSIHIPGNMIFVDDSNFKLGYTAYSVAPDNEYYSAENGVLYNKERTILYKCPTSLNQEIFVVPDTVEIINDYALYNAGSQIINGKSGMINEVVIPESVKEIGDYAFYDSLLDKVTFSEGLESIGKYAFYYSTIDEFVLPDSLKYLGDYVFSYMRCDTIFKVGPRIENVNGTTFYRMARDNCVFDFDENSKYVLFENGMYNRELTELFWYMEFNAGKVVFPDTLEIIQDKSMYGVKNITEIEFPDSLKEIGEEAFINCEILTEVVLNDGLEKIGNKAFYFGGFESITIPKTVKSIGVDAFSGNKLLKTINFLGAEGFSLYGDEGCLKECELLEKITIPMNADLVSQLDNYRETLKILEINDTATQIPDNAFSDLSYLTEIILPGTITAIGEFAFKSCESVERIIVPESVKTIGAYAFMGCEKLKTTNLPKQITEISDAQYFNCYSLTDMTISDSVTRIGGYAFYGCGVTDFVIPNSVTTIGESAFENSSVQKLLLSSNITEIPALCFAECGMLEYVKIPDSVTNISESAFCGCQNLITVVLGNSVETIGKSAFEDCRALVNVTFPETLVSIGKDAFAYCISLNRVNLNNGLTTIGKGAFDYCIGLTELNIPKTVTEFVITSSFSEELTSLEAINVEEGNTLYSSMDGVVFSADKKTLQFYPMNKGGKIYKVPSGTEIISEGAFSQNPHLEVLIIPDSVTSVQDTLENLTSLKKVFVPDTVTDVAVNFLGANRNNNNALSSAVICCEPGSAIHIFAIEEKLNYAIILNSFLMSAPNLDEVALDDNSKTITTSQLGILDLNTVVSVDEECFADVEGVEDNIYYGTGTIIKIKDYNNNVLGEYTLVVEGDVNGDGVCDVIDAMLVSMEITSSEAILSENGVRAADLAKTDTLDMTDFQAVVNRCLGK